MMPRVNMDDLARRLDLRKRPRSWGGDCPACSYSNAFSMKPGKSGGVRCYCANGCTLDQLDDALQHALGADWTPPARLPDGDVAAQRAGKQAAALRLFSGSTPLTAIDPAARYLARRGLVAFVGCPALRYRGDCHHQAGGRHPALVAEVLDVAGRPIAVHRCYLTREEAKAVLEPCKVSLGPTWGGAVRLTPDSAPPPAVLIGEGIESAASAGLLLGLPAWAALSAGNLGGGLVLPAAVRSVIIGADADKVGQREAQAAARCWRAEGRTVRVALPDTSGQDFNDILQNRAGRAAEAAHGRRHDPTRSGVQHGGCGQPGAADPGCRDAAEDRVPAA